MNFIRRDMDMTGGVAVGGLVATQPPERKWPLRYDSVEPTAILIDAAIILSASILAGIICHYRAFGTAGDIIQYFGSAMVVAALFISLMRTRGMYRPKELLALRSQIRAVCLRWVAVLLLLAGTVLTLKIGNELSRGTSLLFAVIGGGALILHRFLWRTLLSEGIVKRKFSGRKVVLITDDRQSAQQDLSHTLTGLGFRLERHFTLPPAELGRREREEAISKAIACMRGSDVDEIVVGADLNHWAELCSLIAELRILPFPVHLVPVGAVSEIFKQPHHERGNAICIEVQRGPLTPIEYASKRCLDIVLAGTALIALAPVFALVAIAIKIDSPGPVLFRQGRCGFNGRCFQILKFRTMLVQEDGDAVTQAKRSDSRITPLGKWLRRTSIDELPQLLNVLDGSMSLVGPRPHAVLHDSQFDKVVRNYAFRHRVKPGLTGWAQVHGCRGPTPTPKDIERRVEYDLWYVDNWSFALDFSIMLQTVFEVLRGRNAY